MEVLLACVLPAVLFLVLQWIWNRPAWLRVPDAVRGVAERAAPGHPPPEQDPFALPFIRHRIGVMAAELERLDDDPGVFARAFRMRVARYAYEALLADAERLAAAATIEVEYAVVTTARREELDV